MSLLDYAFFLSVGIASSVIVLSMTSSLGKVRWVVRAMDAFGRQSRRQMRLLSGAPVIIGEYRPEAGVTWHNLTRFADLSAGEKRLFEAQTLDLRFDDGRDAHRIQLSPPDGPVRWFDITSREHARGHDLFAVQSTDLVQARQSSRAFVSALSETFAHLSTGLVVFSRDRRLSLFNPAVTDLTGLSPEWLATRPTLMGFLDHLREKRVIGEPQDYKLWRERMTAMEAATSKAGFLEDWPLPDGRTFRIQARPHPNGALAILIHDVSPEIKVARDYRTEVETLRAVINTIAAPMAVFAPGGALYLTNRSYDGHWGDDTADQIDVPDIGTVTRSWASKCMPNSVWGDIREFVVQTAQRSNWSAVVNTMHNGPATLDIFALRGGFTLFRFAADPATTRSIEEETRLSIVNG